MDAPAAWPAELLELSVAAVVPLAVLLWELVVEAPLLAPSSLPWMKVRASLPYSVP